MNARLRSALAAAAAMAAASDALAAEQPPIVASTAMFTSDPRGIAQPSPFGHRPWVRWYCNLDGSNCLVFRRHRTRVQCERALYRHLAATRIGDAKCTYEG